jgi:hypothetical protein
LFPSKVSTTSSFLPKFLTILNKFLQLFLITINFSFPFPFYIPPFFPNFLLPSPSKSLPVPLNKSWDIGIAHFDTSKPEGTKSKQNNENSKSLNLRSTPKRFDRVDKEPEGDDTNDLKFPFLIIHRSVDLWQVFVFVGFVFMNAKKWFSIDFSLPLFLYTFKLPSRDE